jgi:hypothetical protein
MPNTNPLHHSLIERAKTGFDTLQLGSFVNGLQVPCKGVGEEV